MIDGDRLREVPEGNWGAAGQQVRYSQLVEASKAEKGEEVAAALSSA